MCAPARGGAEVKDCYAALSWVHERFTPIVPEEFDDYIAAQAQRLPVAAHRGARRCRPPMEIQIRTQAMHEHAEHGVAAHWAYKEAGAKGYAGVSASGDYDAKIAVLRQLLAWERDLAGRARACSTTASTCSRPRPPWWNCPRAPRRWTLPTACTPAWATAAAVRASMAPWCR
jgi:(p)ppGpp synthase/HD superfamily hydrolase